MRESARTFRRPIPKKNTETKNKDDRIVPALRTATEESGRSVPRPSAGQPARVQKNIQAAVKTVIRRMKRGGSTRSRPTTLSFESPALRTGTKEPDRMLSRSRASYRNRPPLPAGLKTAGRKTRQPGFSPAFRNLYPRKRGSEEPPEARPEDALSPESSGPESLFLGLRGKIILRPQPFSRISA